MKTIRLLLLVALVAFCPAPAYALEGWWDWLDALSGPGPYVGLGAIGHSFCVPGMPRPANTNCFQENRERDQRFRQVIDVRTGWMTDVGDRFQDDPGDLGSANVWSLEGIYLFRLSGSFQIDVGPGVGLMRFSGKDRSGEDSFDAIYRFTIIPVSFSFAPLAPKDVDWLRLRLDSIYVPEGFSGDQFGNTVTSFRSGGEFLTRMAVVFRY